MPKVHSPETRTAALEAFKEMGTAAGAARKLGIARTSIDRWIREEGLKPARRGGHPKVNVTEEQRAKMVRLYLENKLTNKEVLAEVGLSDQRPDLLYSTLRSRGVQRKMPATANTGRKQPVGTRVTNEAGYVRVKVPDDWPYRKEMPGSGDGTWVLEHRRVMAEALGRALRRDEEVHHRDGNKGNNALSNLQIRYGAHGTGTALKCGKCGSNNLVAEDI